MTFLTIGETEDGTKVLIKGRRVVIRREGSDLGFRLRATEIPFLVALLEEGARRLPPAPIRAIRSLREMEAEAIQLAMEQTKGNRVKAAAILGISERTLYRRLKETEVQSA